MQARLHSSPLLTGKVTRYMEALKVTRPYLRANKQSHSPLLKGLDAVHSPRLVRGFPEQSPSNSNSREHSHSPLLKGRVVRGFTEKSPSRSDSREHTPTPRTSTASALRISPQGKLLLMHVALRCY